MNLNIRIERLILDGLPLTTMQGRELQAAVEFELARLLVDGGRLPELPAGIAVERVAGETIRLAGDVKPSGLGFQIAGAVHSGLAKGFSARAMPGSSRRSETGRSSPVGSKLPDLRRL